MDAAPDKCKLKMAKSTAGPECAKILLNRNCKRTCNRNCNCKRNRR